MVLMQFLGYPNYQAALCGMTMSWPMNSSHAIYIHQERMLPWMSMLTYWCWFISFLSMLPLENKINTYIMLLRNLPQIFWSQVHLFQICISKYFFNVTETTDDQPISFHYNWSISIITSSIHQFLHFVLSTTVSCHLALCQYSLHRISIKLPLHAAKGSSTFIIDTLVIKSTRRRHEAKKI